MSIALQAETASIPAPGDGAEDSGGAAPGPRGRETAREGRSDKARPWRRGRRLLPRELRVRAFEEVLRLRKEGLSYTMIAREVLMRCGVRLSKSSISGWVRGIHCPYNGRRIPSLEMLEPSEELAYTVGVVLGDGYVKKRRRVVKGYNEDEARIGLEAKDGEFVAEFGRCLSKILGREPIKLHRRYGRYVIEVQSKTLYELLKKPVDLDRLRSYIEHCERCIAAFLRGLFDSEGCVSECGHIHIYNTDLKLLEYVRELLERLGIESTGPKIQLRRGRVFYEAREGKYYVARKDVYRLYIRSNSLIVFYRRVGFTIRRKMRRLEDYLRRILPLTQSSLPLGNLPLYKGSSPGGDSNPCEAALQAAA